MAKTPKRIEHIYENPHELADRHLRQIRAKCDVLFTFACQGGTDIGAVVQELETETLAEYLSDMLDSCGYLADALEKIERTTKAAA